MDRRGAMLAIVGLIGVPAASNAQSLRASREGARPDIPPSLLARADEVIE